MLVNSISHLSELGADAFTITSLLKVFNILRSTFTFGDFADVSTLNS